MTATARAAGGQRAASVEPRGLAFGAARVARWLLVGPAQQSDGVQAGAVAGWVGAGDRADYVYPEITGYFLQWLAWMSRRHGREQVYVVRAEAAVSWLARWLADDRPLTRIYVNTPREDWRNDARFAFDLAMVLRGIAAAAQAGLVAPPPTLVDRTCDNLSRLIAEDGQLDACAPYRDDAELPARWSTRRGPFLVKAAAGIIDAARTLPSVPASLSSAAERTFDASLDALVRAPHDETHPFLYAVEGFLANPQHAAFAERLPRIVAHFDTLIDRSMTIGRVPEASSEEGPVRLDIVAQSIRAGLLLDAHRRDGISLRRELDSLADALAQYVHDDGALPFSPDVPDLQFNVWTAMFAEQALALAYLEPREIARIAASPSIV